MKRNFALIIAISTLIIGLTACLEGKSISLIDKMDDFENSDQGNGSSTTDNDKAQTDFVVEKFVNALNAEEPQEILECVDPEKVCYYTIETVETAISDFKTYFKNKLITQYRQVSNSSNDSNSYVYELISESGDKLKIDVVYDEQQDISWIRCEFLDYSYQSKHLLEKFTYALERESKMVLAQILTLDDFDCSISDAAEIIEKYKEHFDLESLEYKFVDIDPKKQVFIYNIIGQKDGTAVEHAVEISYKDGIIRLNDPWISYKVDNQ
mgnify:CR=1 FL=1